MYRLVSFLPVLNTNVPCYVMLYSPVNKIRRKVYKSCLDWFLLKVMDVKLLSECRIRPTIASSPAPAGISGTYL